jgi:hypothetical protein
MGLAITLESGHSMPVFVMEASYPTDVWHRSSQTKKSQVRGIGRVPPDFVAWLDMLQLPRSEPPNAVDIILNFIKLGLLYLCSEWIDHPFGIEWYLVFAFPSLYLLNSMNL